MTTCSDRAGQEETRQPNTTPDVILACKCDSLTLMWFSNPFSAFLSNTLRSILQLQCNVVRDLRSFTAAIASRT